MRTESLAPVRSSRTSRLGAVTSPASRRRRYSSTESSLSLPRALSHTMKSTAVVMVPRKVAGIDTAIRSMKVQPVPSSSSLVDRKTTAAEIGEAVMPRRDPATPTDRERVGRMLFSLATSTMTGMVAKETWPVEAARVSR